MAPVYAAERMTALIAILAPDGRCALCGTKPRTKRLQIDHVDGRDWTPRNHNAWIRAARYWREFESGVRLRALCKRCNGGYRPPGYLQGVSKIQWQKPQELEDAPF